MPQCDGWPAVGLGRGAVRDRGSRPHCASALQARKFILIAMSKIFPDGVEVAEVEFLDMPSDPIVKVLSSGLSVQLRGESFRAELGKWRTLLHRFSGPRPQESPEAHGKEGVAI